MSEILSDNRVRPGMQRWTRDVTLSDGSRVSLRVLVPKDAELYPAFIARVDADDLRLRFFGPVKDTGPAFIARWTQFDRTHAVAFIAIDQETAEMVGVARLHADTADTVGEFAILVRSDWQRRGIGPRLMTLLIEYGRAAGLGNILGHVMRENTGMLRLSRELGFRTTSAAGGVVRITLELTDTAVEPAGTGLPKLSKSPK